MIFNLTIFFNVFCNTQIIYYLMRLFLNPKGQYIMKYFNTHYKEVNKEKQIEGWVGNMFLEDWTR